MSRLKDWLKSFRPKKTAITTGVLIVVVVLAILTHLWINSNAEESGEDDAEGIPIGERTEWGWSYCLKLEPENVEVEPGTNVSFHLTWRADHYDCPFYLPYGRTTEGIEQNTEITLTNLRMVDETEWVKVEGRKDTFEKDIVVQAQNRDGKIKVLRECPWYFDQQVISQIDVPTDADEEQEKTKTFTDYWNEYRKEPLFVMIFVLIVTLAPILIAWKVVKSFNTLRIISQIAFFVGINMSLIGLWSIRTPSLPRGAAIPGAACNYLHYNVGNCIVYQLQHFLSSGLNGSTLPYLIMLILVFTVLFVALGKAWCGWVCPLGFIQDILSWVRRKLKIKRHHVTPFQRELFVITKYALLFAGFVLSIIIGIHLITYYLPTGELYRPICQVCPAYPLFTFIQGFLGIGSAAGMENVPIWSIAVLIAFLGTAFVMRRPFCKICPIGALIGFFSKVSGVSLHKDGQKCSKCGMCYRACPMDVTDVMDEMDKDDITTNDCVLCMRCVEMCPEEDCLSGKLFGANMTRSSYRKFMMQHPVRFRKVLKKYATKPAPLWVVRLYKKAVKKLRTSKEDGS